MLARAGTQTAPMRRGAVCLGRPVGGLCKRARPGGRLLAGTPHGPWQDFADHRVPRRIQFEEAGGTLLGDCAQGGLRNRGGAKARPPAARAAACGGSTTLPCRATAARAAQVVLFNWEAELVKWLPRLPASTDGLSPAKVMVLSEVIDEEAVVRRWFSTPSAVLICTHDKFKGRGTCAGGIRRARHLGSKLSLVHVAVCSFGAAARQAQAAAQHLASAHAPGFQHGAPGCGCGPAGSRVSAVVATGAAEAKRTVGATGQPAAERG